MKQLCYSPLSRPSYVAPHAGAWIETEEEHKYGFDEGVAPHAGAWIETITWSQPWQTITVAPHAGAWIETLIPKT